MQTQRYADWLEVPSGKAQSRWQMTELSPGESTLRMSPEKALLLATNRICRTSSAAVIVPPALRNSTISVSRAASKRLQE